MAEAERRRKLEIFEAEVAKRVEEEVAIRMAAELEKHRDFIEAEVQKRLAQARAQLEQELMGEFEKLKQIEFKKQLEKEVDF